MSYSKYIILILTLCVIINYISMQTSTSVLPALTAVTSMYCVAILWERTHARVKQVIQAMEEHALVSC